jgi:hypothetical protein
MFLPFHFHSFLEKDFGHFQPLPAKNRTGYQVFYRKPELKKNGLRLLWINFSIKAQKDKEGDFKRLGLNRSTIGTTQLPVEQ